MNSLRVQIRKGWGGGGLEESRRLGEARSSHM